MSLIDITTLKIRDTSGLNRLPADTYFVDDTNRNMYSRRSGQSIRIFGTIKGNHRWYTLMPRPNPWKASVYIREDRLLQALQERWTGVSPDLKPVTHSAPVADTTQHRWIVGTVTTDGQYNFAPRPRLHETEASVNEEAERLARINPGQTYVKVRLEGQVVAGGINWS